jgi:hypothetical protein
LQKIYTAKPLKVLPPLGEQYKPFSPVLMLIIEAWGQNILLNFLPCGKKNPPFGETTFFTDASETIFVL